MDRRVLAAASDRDAMTGLLAQILRDLETARSSTVVRVGQHWRLEEDADGNLVATHGPSGRRVTVASPG